MDDASSGATNLQISRSGRILKKSVKLMEYEDSHTGEADIREKLRKTTTAAKKKRVSSSRRQKSKSTKNLVLKYSVKKSRIVRRNTNKVSKVSSPGAFSEVTCVRENVVPPIKITKISHDENPGEDPSYSVAPSSSRMLDVPYSLDSTEESSSDSTAAASEFSGRDTTLSSHFGPTSIVSEDISESMSDEESSDNSSSLHQLSNGDEEHDAEKSNSVEAATNEESSDDSSSHHQLSNSDEEHGVDRSDKTVAVTDEESALFQSMGCGQRNIPSNDEIKSAVLKRKYPIFNDEDTAVLTARKKGENRITSFMLWNKENRSKISAQYQHLSRKVVSKKVREAWKTLDSKEKNLWQRRAKQLALKGSTAQYLKSKQNTEIAVDTLNSVSDPPAGDSSLEERSKPFSIGTSPIDTAAHLALLGNSLTNIGSKIAELDYEPSKTGVYSTLLDSILCAVGPLLCLTREIAGLEHLPCDNFQKILDHTAYFFPGL